MSSMAPQPPGPAEPHEPTSAREPRFLTLADVAEILATSVSQVRALVKNRELRAIQIGGRGQWRVEMVELEKFIARMYEQADARDATDGRTDGRADDRVDHRLG
jgi:excisionase family DNA binding protein